MSANQGLSSRARGIAPPGKAELSGAEALGKKPWGRSLGAEALGQAVRGDAKRPWGKRCYGDAGRCYRVMLGRCCEQDGSAAWRSGARRAWRSAVRARLERG
eukprot:scaffold55527_cov59-Phaeocystis_antarctica.AAC.2